MNKVDNIRFYFHTSPERPTMGGYQLKEMARKYDVSDLIWWKPEKEEEPGGNIDSIPRTTKIDFRESERPELPDERRELFRKFGFIDRLNVLDLYVDASSVEGWGLPVIEAMKCGVPTLPVEDQSIRSELYGEAGLDMLQTLPVRTWTTWHTGTKLALLDPRDIANTILRYKNDSELRDKQVKAGLEVAEKYKWQDARDKFVKIINGVLDDAR